MDSGIVLRGSVIFSYKVLISRSAQHDPRTSLKVKLDALC